MRGIQSVQRVPKEADWYFIEYYFLSSIIIIFLVTLLSLGLLQNKLFRRKVLVWLFSPLVISLGLALIRAWRLVVNCLVATFSVGISDSEKLPG